MNVTVNERGASKVAVVVSPDILISDSQSALDLMATIRYNQGCDKVIVKKANVEERFFDLKTGLAGEVMQKFTNYHFRFAIVGDFDGYTSKALRDLIYESNKGKHILFLKTEQEALDALHGV